MSALKVLGDARPVETGVSKEKSERESGVVVVEGLYSDLIDEDPENHCPEGMVLVSSSVTSTEDGLGKMTVRSIKYDDPNGSIGPVRTTFRIDMKEVQYDLEDHPYIQAGREIIVKWLATDASKRSDGSSYYYEDKDGELVEVDDDDALLFIDAYMGGIKTYLRYYPVIEKISIYKNPPGLSINTGTYSFTGGDIEFECPGGFEQPPVNLNGFDPDNYFKSKDSWVENGNKTWTRTEQWTYTPEGEGSDRAWIYEELS